MPKLDWENISLPVSSADNVTTTKRKIIDICRKNHRIFFVYAAGNVATFIAPRSVAEFSNLKSFEGYLKWCKNSRIKGTPYFLGVFYNVSVSDSFATPFTD